MSEQKFTHLKSDGQVNMVDVGDKIITKRTAKARALVQVSDEVLACFTNNDLQTKKGPVFQTAIIAGIMGSKKTSELIPLCHPIGLNKCDLNIRINDENEIEIIGETSINSKTGVEMEAMTAVSVAALTIYDMCKSFGHDIVIKDIRLLEKRGGKSDFNI
ncbi:MAG: cyclic pyranopterin phosphate synthase [Maribacter sp.]|jgi:cyclic pyranopterin phosphate synthase